MSTFRKKARVIQTLDDDLVTAEEPKQQANAPLPDTNEPLAPVKFTRKPNKASSLRKSINFTDDTNAPEDDDDTGAPAVIRPSVSRAGSTKTKRKPASSRLSFGPGAEEEADVEDAPTRKTAGLRAAAVENNAFRINVPSRVLGGEDDRPRYSKEYLSELQSSTPNTPADMSNLTIEDEDVQMAMDIDPSELEGATIVPTPGQETSTTALGSRTPAATILTAAQIKEKKERRARLALQGQADDYIGLDDEDEDDEYRIGKKKEKETRLVREDEDLLEGYDDLVEDGGLSLGRQAEREARLKQRKEMAELIAGAEDALSDSEQSDDSIERREAYEAAQRRKGMGHEASLDNEDELGPDVIPKMKPLPDLEESLQRMRNLVQGLDDEVKRKRERIKQLKKEKGEVEKREAEVQEILNKAGEKYQAALGSHTAALGGAGAAKLAAQSPLRPVMPPGLVANLPVERGLESFGTTPTTRPGEEDDEDMS
ncbi:hypothetical protein DL546_007036 [Coniochaeta pulveracea]|uniref:Nineteen complex-related protein 2 domain-containing protein n=1 Tax=Coniochaeta pulveracea TaxID=177199 RepID=A0A420YKX8_9PEZI|nr:hypothetical protein DL546_007036 [Coniochaeta pulveracea]